jgi:CheY-like chemotaxis protein
MSYILAMVENLFFRARIQAVAKHVGAEVKIVTTGDELVAEAAAKCPGLVIVDLNSPSNPLDAVKKIHECPNAPIIIGYLAHTQTELAEQAAQAGCTKVMSQGRFTEELPVALARARGKLEPKST